MTKTFHISNCPPPEIRNLIWTETLSTDGGALVTFSLNWYFTSIVRDDGTKEGVFKDFVKVAPSSFLTLWVCREARQTTMQWLAAHGYSFQLNTEHDDQCIIVREWDLERDILYIPRTGLRAYADLWVEIRDEPWANEGLEPIELFQHVALPLAAFHHDLRDILWMISSSSHNLQTISVVYEGQPDTLSSPEARPEDAILSQDQQALINGPPVIVQPRYEIRNITDIDDDDLATPEGYFKLSVREKRLFLNFVTTSTIKSVTVVRVC